MKRKTKNVVPVAHKRIVSTIEEYKERVVTDKDLKSEVVDQFIIEISPFFTKKGTLRKNLSNKKIKEFNNLVNTFKNAGYGSLAGIKRTNKQKRNDKRAGTWQDNDFVEDKKTADNIHDLLEDKMVSTLMKKGYLDIYNLRDFSEDDINIDNIQVFKDVADYIVKQMKSDTPSEISDILQNQDDTYQFMRDFAVSKATEFKTRDTFNNWLEDNFTKVKKMLHVKSYNKMSQEDLENAYQNFLKGEFNQWL